MAAHYDTRGDPRHYTAKDGSVRPVLGTHAVSELCAICANGKASARVLPESFPLGALVDWPYGHGFAHGRVIGHGRSRVRVYWHARRPRPIALEVSRLTKAKVHVAPGCATCRDGR